MQTICDLLITGPIEFFHCDWSSERSETRQLGAVSELTMVNGGVTGQSGRRSLQLQITISHFDNHLKHSKVQSQENATTFKLIDEVVSRFPSLTMKRREDDMMGNMTKY